MRNSAKYFQFVFKQFGVKTLSYIPEFFLIHPIESPGTSKTRWINRNNDISKKEKNVLEDLI